jgi:hypothetical protein
MAGKPTIHLKQDLRPIFYSRKSSENRAKKAFAAAAAITIIADFHLFLYLPINCFHLWNPSSETRPHKLCRQSTLKWRCSLESPLKKILLYKCVALLLF